MEHLLRAEAGLRRQRSQRWGARTIDLDILLYGQTCLRLPHLVLPHPRMAFRRFVLEPAAEIAADMVHPELGWTIARLLQHLNTAIPYVAVTGLPKAGKTALAQAVASRCAARLVGDPPMSTGNRAAAVRWDAVATHLEVLERRACLLQLAGPLGDGCESISDFWIEQTKACAESWLSPAERVRYRERHDEAACRLVAPKLLVLLELDRQESLARLRASDSGVAGWDDLRLAGLERRLSELALSPQRQPVLRLPAERFSDAVEEVVAAMETMR